MTRLTLLAAFLCASPILALLLYAFQGESVFASPIIAPLLGQYIINSSVIATGSALLSLAVGTGCAWCVFRYEFPARRWVEWVLLLPLAVPPYLLAMVLAHQLDVAGPVQSALRDFLGWEVGDYWFPNIRSRGGVIIALGFTLYPYVYLAARHAFSQLDAALFEAGWLWGRTPNSWLWRIAIPMSRPALALGASLVMMEALADFGVVSLFGVPTFTTGIFRLWYGLFSPEQAAQLALILLALVMLLIALERMSRARSHRYSAAQSGKSLARERLCGVRGGAMLLCCSLPWLVGFALPVVQFLQWSVTHAGQWRDVLHWQAAGYSLSIAACAALLTVALATAFAYRLRAHPSSWQRSLLRLATSGYAVPGAVIAIAVFMPLLQLDQWLASQWQNFTGTSPALLITGSIAAIVIACSIRFVAVALAPIESGLKLLPRAYDEAALSLGASKGRLLRELHWPGLKFAIGAAGFMVFADTLKELPATYLLRPFEVTTLSIRSFELASDGRLTAAAIPALMMIAIGIGGVLLLSISLREKTLMHRADVSNNKEALA